MKALIATALALTTLFALAVPAMAFDTQNLGKHGSAWQTDVRRVMRNTSVKTIPHTVHYLDRLTDVTLPYLRFVEGITPNTCQSNAGFRKHYLAVLTFYNHEVRAYNASLRRDFVNAGRHIKAGTHAYGVADDTGATILRRCW